MIKPSRIKRWLYVAIHLLSLTSIFVADLNSLWQTFLASAVLLSVGYDLYRKQVTRVLFWDLVNCEISLAELDEPLQACLGISSLHLLFGILLLRIKHLDQSHTHLLIFPDSVNFQSYRRLRVAARWAKITTKVS